MRSCDIIGVICCILLISGYASSYQEDVLPASYPTNDEENNDDISKRPFGRLFGPTWSKRPFGRLFGAYTKQRPNSRLYRATLSKSKRPFGRMFGHTFSTGKRSPMEDNEYEMSPEVLKRPFGRLFGPTLLGKRTIGTILGGGYKLGKRSPSGEDSVNSYDILETPLDDISKRYSWTMSGYKLGKR